MTNVQVATSRAEELFLWQRSRVLTQQACAAQGWCWRTIQTPRDDYC